MSEKADRIKEVLAKFGLDSQEANIYLYLLESSLKSALEIARKLAIPRTKVYRILDKLVEKRMVVQNLESSGFRFEAVGPESLGVMVAKKESECGELRALLPETIMALEQLVGAGRGGSTIRYYRGVRGLSQVNWNILRANREYLSYEVENANAYLPKAEAEKLRQALVEKRLLNRMLTNRSQFDPFTGVSELVLRWWQPRVIPREVLDIKMDMFIYNDIFAVCNYLDNGDIFCFELQNERVAKMQKQLFEVIWKGAKPIITN